MIRKLSLSGCTLAIADAFLVVDAQAEQLGMELLSTKLSSAQDESTPFDEIIVFGNREKTELPEQRAVSEALLKRILRDFELSQETQLEIEWRLRAAKLDSERPRLRLGYDPREQAREPVFEIQRMLPMDIVAPATVVSVDF